MDATIRATLKQITEYYKDDKIAPGMVTAWLPGRKTFYCSIRRYGIGTENPRRADVITAYESTSYRAAVLGCVRNWRRLTDVIDAAKPSMDKRRGESEW
jgi:hypothetical protein